MREHDQPCSNPSKNSPFQAILESRLTRRDVLASGLAAAAAAWLGGRGAGPARAAPVFGFQGIPVSREDRVVVRPGYTADVLYAWGDPVSDGPVFKPDASSTAEEQAQQAGMHHDGVHFFPLPAGTRGSSRGLLAMNHEYTDDGLLHVGGMEPWTALKVAKAQAAHGVSVVEVAEIDGAWQVVRPSPYARRITAATPMRFAGPAAGHRLLQTGFDPTGATVLGTVNNCAMGHTPWGTYLACEENFNGYFVNGSATLPAPHRRYGISAKGAGYRWHEHDERFDAARHPNEPNRFGWVVEIDPFDPRRQPVKHTALGRLKHEGAQVTLAPDRRVVVYMGDDERAEYIYKFVSEGRYDPGQREANLALLERGTLYVARFAPDGTGEWRALVHGQNGLDATGGFADQAEVSVMTRQAADRAGATPMDRPEWIAVNEQTHEVYCTLTNNSTRGAEGGPPVDPANPRARNVFGHIIRWRERNADPAATEFAWDVFLLCGDPASPAEARRGNVNGDAFGSPDGLWLDGRGVLWIQTDVSPSTLLQGDYAGLGHNQMLAADPVTREVRRFLTGPAGCEITGVTATPDGRTMFVNIQHPGETPSERSDPARPTAISSWPGGERPRAATVVIRKRDGGVVGT
jgi:secreted PhoX family phosphatase